MLQLRDVSKNFGEFVALRAINFTVNEGEIVGLLGENGAGKSTLLNLVGGHIQPSAGAMMWRDKTVHFSNPRDASRCGIGVVHQHPQLVEAFTAAENLALAAASSTQGARFRHADWEKRVEGWAQELGWNIEASARVENLSVGQRQRIEILKALFAQGDEVAQLLLLDEPTANLTPHEADELFTVMRRLKTQRCGLVFVSHKLPEVMAICDRVVVLRRGEVVGERLISQTSSEELAQLMIGSSSQASPTSTRVPSNDAPVKLKINNLSCGVLRDFSLSVRSGEIVGLAGVDGNGQAELVEALSGLRESSGTVSSDGEIAIIPPDRERSGLIADFTLAENVALNSQARSQFRRFARFDWQGAQALTCEMMTRYDVRTPQTAEKTPARQLSGGNQQKLLIARALQWPHGVVVAADPTRGLDIGAARFVHEQLHQAARNGAAVLLISTDLDEVMALSHRIGVLYEGRLLPDAQLLPRDTERAAIGKLMGGEVSRQEQVVVNS